jgi:hypothetical protein
MQMRIRIEHGLDLRSRAGFWPNDRAGVRAVRTIQGGKNEVRIRFENIINITITILGIIHRPVFYLQLNSVGLSVPHRKHTTSPPGAQQVNAIYRFVTMVY